jgi:transcription antitermination factor NusG
LRVGGPVRLTAGPFIEQLAILDDLDDAERVRVLLDIFGRAGGNYDGGQQRPAGLTSR